MNFFAHAPSNRILDFDSPDSPLFFHNHVENPVDNVDNSRGFTFCLLVMSIQRYYLFHNHTIMGQSGRRTGVPVLYPSLSKKPRRVSRRRREKAKIDFLRRHAPGRILLPLRGNSPSVRRRKYISARKRASCLPQADSECAAAGRILFKKVASPLF